MDDDEQTQNPLPEGLAESVVTAEDPLPDEDPDSSSEQRWKNRLAKEEKKRTCTRCKEIGHSCLNCPYPIQYMKVPGTGKGPDGLTGVVLTVSDSKKTRCSRCGRRGHNRRTCHGPLFSGTGGLP